MGVDLALNLTWKLLKESIILLLRNSLVVIIFPAVVEVILDSLLHFNVNVLALVELLD
jgi:hypothetical protein